MKPGATFQMAEVYEAACEQFDEPLFALKSYEGWAWNHPSISALRLMLEVAGFRDIEILSRPKLSVTRGSVRQAPKVVFRARR
jgi:hypothetical protein